MLILGYIIFLMHYYQYEQIVNINTQTKSYHYYVSYSEQIHSETKVVVCGLD